MSNMTTKIVVAVAAVGVLLTILIVKAGPRGSTAESSEGAEASYPRGPQGGRLLSDDGLQVEVTIFEPGTPPQFRVFPFDDRLRPLPPAEVELRIELHRLGGRIDSIAFRPEASYLQGLRVVEEPHSFDVKVFATHAGREYQWEYGQIEGKVELGAGQRATAGITIDTAGPRAILTTLTLPGVVRPDETRRASIASRVRGTVTAVRKQEGDRVAAGEILAIIDSRELADAKSSYLIAERQVEFGRVTMEREETLWRRKISPERDYLEARQDFEEARLRARLAAQNLVVLGVPAADLAGLANEPPDQASRLAIRTPLAGRVIERTATAGETVNADQSLFVVADLSSVWVDVAVNATDLAAVREGQAVTVRSNDLDREARGRVAFVTAVVGEASRTATARIVVPNPDGQWRPGLFVTALLERESTEAPVVVATEAIQTFRDWQVVFVRYGDWFEARPVELGRSDGKWVEILSGLAAGDEYARENSFVVKAEIGKLGATHDH